MIISAIAACDEQGAIGFQNQIPWHLPADLAHFKRLTLHHCILMGYKTFLSLPKLLPDRLHLVLSREHLPATGLQQPENLRYIPDISAALAVAEARGEQELFIIGGGQIYQQTAAIWDRLYLSKVATQTKQADAFFPAIPAHLQLVDSQRRPSDGKNPFDIEFCTYQKHSL